MAGYRPDHSMSNRAHKAYENNIRPYSRWSKKDILDALPAEVVGRIRTTKLPDLVPERSPAAA